MQLRGPIGLMWVVRTKYCQKSTWLRFILYHSWLLLRARHSSFFVFFFFCFGSQLSTYYLQYNLNFYYLINILKDIFSLCLIFMFQLDFFAAKCWILFVYKLRMENLIGMQICWLKEPVEKLHYVISIHYVFLFIYKGLCFFMDFSHIVICNLWYMQINQRDKDIEKKKIMV